MILLFKRRREREKALAAENAAKASKSQVPTSSRASNFEKFNQRTSRSLSPSPSIDKKPSTKSKSSMQAAGSSKASGSTENLRTSSLKIPKSNGSERRKSSGGTDENSGKNEENANSSTDASDPMTKSQSISISNDDHLWSSSDQFDRNLPFIPSVGRAKISYSFEPPQLPISPESPDHQDSSLSYLLTSCVSNNQRSSITSLSPVSESIYQFPTAPKISVEDFGNPPNYDDVMASLDYKDREP